MKIPWPITVALLDLYRCLRRDPGRPPSPAPFPPLNPIELDDDAATARREAALQMMDEDCYGFLVITVHKEGIGGDLRVCQRMHPDYWPAVRRAVEMIDAELSQ